MLSFYIVAIALLAIFLMAIVPSLVKLVEVNEVVIALARLSIASIGLSIFPSVFKSLFRLSKRDWFGLFLIGFVFALHWFLYFKSIKLSTPSIAAVAVATYAIHLLIINFIFRRQKLSKLDSFLVVVAFFAVVIMVPDMTLESDLFIGAVLGVASGFLYALLPLLHQRYKAIPTLVRAWAQFSLALIFYLPFLPAQDWRLSNESWLILIILGVLSTLAAHTLWIKATTELPNILSGILYYLYIPLALIISYLLSAEQLTITSWLGALTIVFANVVLVLRQRKMNSKEATQSKKIN